ncbi:MAG: hypothetical protein WC998_09085 [Candidatus Paceibacterota bacterium]
MILFYIIYGFVFLLTLILLMGQMVRWGVESDVINKKKWSKLWHGYSVVFRSGVMVLWVVLFWGQWFLLSVLSSWFVVFSWMIWDGIIALHLQKDFWYIGSTAEIDKIFTKTTSMILKLVVLAIAIVLTTTYLILR